MEILKKIQLFIESELLINQNDRILVGVSGGADSVVLIDVLQKLEYDCVAAHCNFHLRGAESDRDEKFVQNLAEKLNLPYVKTDFDTIGYAEKKKISIEMAARELRYEWFKVQAELTGSKYIATAHQLMTRQKRSCLT